MSGTTVTTEVISIENVTEYVHVIKLKPLTTAHFQAGQYLQLVLSPEDKRVFSVASSPDADLIELHIGANPGDEYPMGAIDHIRNNQYVDVEIGLGNAYLKEDSSRPIILMAGGTGFSYVKSIADYLATHKPNHTVLLYWGSKNKPALYAFDEMTEWAANHPHFQFTPVIEEADEEWSGKTGYVHQAILADIVSLEPYDIYLAGPFKMAGIARDDFIKHGAIKEHMYADAFAFI